MRRLIMLTAVALIAAAASGCCRFFNRGALCDTCPPTATIGDGLPTGVYIPPGDTTLPGPSY